MKRDTVRLTMVFVFSQLFCLILPLHAAVYVFDPNYRNSVFPLDQEVILEGVVQVCEFFGPPSFGEDPSDEKSVERQLYLQTPVDIKVAYEQGATAENKYRQAGPLIQLVPLSDVAYKRVRKLKGQRVRVRGTLFWAETGHHHTPVLIQFKDQVNIQPIKAYGEWKGK
jgi:hypothetical protein